MVAVKVQLAQRYTATDSERLDDLDGLLIRQTLPGGAAATLNLPNAWSENDIELRMRGLERRGFIVPGGALDGAALWRYVKNDWVPAWIPPDPVQALALTQVYEPGDTFHVIGITADVQRRGNWGAVSVGIADTWVDVSHPWLAGKRVVQGGAGADGQAHGTHVTTTAAGQLGIASDASLFTYNCLPNGRGSEEEIQRACRWLAEQGVQVANFSLGSGGNSRLIDEGVAYLQAAGCVVCAAAGNDPNAAMGSPARGANWVVLAIDREGRYASFTSGRTWRDVRLICAVGVDVVAGFPGGQSGAASGTSMACPMIAGAVALLRGAT